eukprot:TRINITY_DN9099_c0_g1_i1.p1 TRINITY_DN9099_c0_g1~~TRINITY_DN9099_c0_g1_i1.p1  ORF type:complete len:331 (-),score=75.77 TRINITY_DN9099_c0_g1_i1:12-1004(-)
MEKYNTWADKHTGVQPFIPPYSKKRKETGFDKVKNGVLSFIGILLLIVRFVLIAVLGCVLYVGHALIPCLVVSVVKHWGRRVLDIVVVRLILLCLGYVWIESSFMRSKKRNPMPTGMPGMSIRVGDLIVANHCSYVDLLYLQYRFSPIFTIAPNQFDSSVPSGVVYQYSDLFQALKHTSVPETVHHERDCGSLDQIRAQNPDRIVVVFTEGCTTNGKILLNCVPTILPDPDVEGDDSIHIIGFKYPNSTVTGCFTAGKFSSHFFRLIKNPLNKMKVFYVIPDDVPVPLVEDDVSQIFGLLASCLSVRMGEIFCDYKHEFLEYFNEQAENK